MQVYARRKIYREEEKAYIFSGSFELPFHCVCVASEEAKGFRVCTSELWV